MRSGLFAALLVFMSGSGLAWAQVVRAVTSPVEAEPSLADAGGSAASSILAADHGVKCDGKTNDQPALQAVIDRHPGSLIVLPRGRCDIAAPLVIRAPNTHLAGQGAGVTSIYATYAPDSTSLGAITISGMKPAERRISRVTISDLRLWARGGEALHGVGLQIINGGYTLVQNVEISNFFTNLDIAGGDNQRFVNDIIGGDYAFKSPAAGSSNVYIHSSPKSTGGSYEPYGINLIDCVLSGPGGHVPVLEYGMLVTAVDGLRVVGSYIGEARVNMAFKAEPEGKGLYFSNISVSSTFFDGNVGESETSVAFLDTPGSAANVVWDTSFVGDMFGTNTKYGVYLGFPGITLSFSGNTFDAPYDIYNKASRMITVSGNTFVGCAAAAIASPSGGDAELNSFAVTGNSFECRGTNPSVAFAMPRRGNPALAIVGNSFHRTTNPVDIDPAIAGTQIMANIGAGKDSAGGDRVRVVRESARLPIELKSSDHDVIIATTGNSGTEIALPKKPREGQTYRIKDGKGDAARNHITIMAAPAKVDGESSYTIRRDYGSVELTYNGTQWNVLAAR